MRNQAKYYYVTCSGCQTMRWTSTPDRLCWNCAHKAKLASCRAGAHRKVKGEIVFHDVCSSCGKELWRHKEYLGKLCGHCTAIQNGRRGRGSRNGRWKGGRSFNRYGYVELTIPYNDPYVAMARKHGCTVLEHRYVMAQHLERCLESWEVVHHKNGIKTDNRIENLEVLPKQSDHVCIQQLEKRVKTLEEELWLLRSELGLRQYGNLVLSGGAEPPKCVETRYPVSFN